jgi:hypothetical protein
MVRGAILVLNLACLPPVWAADEAPPSRTGATGGSTTAQVQTELRAAAEPAPAAPAAPAASAADGGRGSPEELAGGAPQPTPIPTPVPGPEDQRLEAKADGDSTEPATIAQLLGRKSALSLLFETQYRQKAILDQTPKNDMAVIYDFVLRYKPTKALGGFLIAEFQEYFVAEVGDSPWRFSDLQVGGSFRHSIPLAGLRVPFLAERPIAMTYSLRAWLPTSRASISQNLVIAPEARAAARFPVFGDLLALGLDLRTVVRAHRTANGTGPGALSNNRFVVYFSPGLESEVLKLGRWGALSVHGDVNWTWANRYPSSESYLATSSSQSPWFQQLGWDLGVSYRPKPWAKLDLSLEQNGNVRRNGFYRPIIVHRDETELVATLGLTF